MKSEQILMNYLAEKRANITSFVTLTAVKAGYLNQFFRQ